MERVFSGLQKPFNKPKNDFPWGITNEESLQKSKLRVQVSMVAVPQDILTVSADKLPSMKIDMTIVGGKILYDRNA